MSITSRSVDLLPLQISLLHMIHFRRFVSGPSGRMSWIRNGPESLGAQNIIEAIDNRNNLRVAKENNILYIAFPAISYGSSG